MTTALVKAMAPHADLLSVLGGEGKMVEIDETYVGGLEKNKHREQRKHGGTGGAGKEAVFSLVERRGTVRSHHVPAVTAATLRPILKAQVHEATFVMTDEGATDKSIGRDFKSMAWSITVLANTFAVTFTPTRSKVISRSSSAASTALSPFSQQHLKRYLAEFDFRYNERIALGVTDAERAAKALRGTVGKRLTYRSTNKASQNASAE